MAARFVKHFEKVGRPRKENALREYVAVMLSGKEKDWVAEVAAGVERSKSFVIRRMVQKAMQEMAPATAIVRMGDKHAS